MKKFSVLGIAALMAFMFVAPAMATDVDFSGAYRVRGMFDHNRALVEDNETTCSYMDMRLRLNTVFKVTDALTLTTRLDALERKWGTSDDDEISSATTATTDDAGVTTYATTSTADSEDNIDFDRAYMTIKSNLGMFIVGRQAGGTFGLSFSDSVEERDRIKYVLPLDNFTLIGIIEKQIEGDATTATNDEDKDVYYLAGIYKGEIATIGGLMAFINSKANGGSGNAMLLIPYFDAKFGQFGLKWEMDYLLGDASETVDYNAFATMLEGTYAFASVPANAELGLAYVSGDDGLDASDAEAYPYGTGDDWEKLFLMTGYAGGHSSVGGGNYCKTGMGKAGPSSLGAGLTLLYTGGDYKLFDDIKLSAMLGYGIVAEDTVTAQEDDLGVEFDLKLDWKLMDKLTYQAVAAYLAAGDAWQSAGATKGEAGGDFALYHKLQLSF